MSSFERPTPLPATESMRQNPFLRVDSIDGTVLSPIVEKTLERVRTLPEVTDEELARARAERRAHFRAMGTEDPQTRRGLFVRALCAPGRRVIMEVKAASPSRGLMRSRVDLGEYAAVYGRFADAVSVLTEPDFFGGSFRRLADLRRLTEKPLLAKDFVVDERQILAAYRSGADAVLLMLSVLSGEGYEALSRFARSLELDILTEASTAEEIHEALSLGAGLIGINNRNLRTLEVDIGTVSRLSREVKERSRIVAESGYRTFAEMARTTSQAPAASIFLAGSALSESADLSLGARRLLYGESKCCGITRACDAVAAARAGATTVGIILTPRSKRYVPLERAQKLAAEIRETASRLTLRPKVALVIDANQLEALPRMIDALEPERIQIHGELPREDLAAVKSVYPEIELAPAFGMGGLDMAGAAKLARRIEALLDGHVIDYAVLDNSTAAGSGGTGKSFDFSLLQAFGDKSRLILAGGLSPKNAREAVLTGAAGFDFNSGVETAPGIKSEALIHQAFAALRSIA